MKKVKVGVIGCGMISEVYMKNITGRFSDVLELTACANRSMEAAMRRARQFNIRVMSVDELLESPDVDIVLNLTIPEAHYEINKKALLAGKHCYSEKPLALTLDEGRELLQLAKARGLLVASAPDTFLGAGLQTSMALINEGAIGRPISAQAFMLACGPERFHPNPGFFYQNGAGPLFDMGPYYYTAMAAAFGPAKRVAGFASRSAAERPILVKESRLYPGSVPVEVDTHVSGMIEFESGVIANVITSWEFPFWDWQSPLPMLTALGTEGTLFMPNPNRFDGSDMGEPGKFISRNVYLRRGDGEKEAIPLKYDYAEESRGVGLNDFARCIREGGTPRVSGEMSLHVLEMMLGVLESSRTGESYRMTTTFTKPELLGKEI